MPFEPQNRGALTLALDVSGLNMADALLAFGEALTAEASFKSVDDLRSALQFIITVWNAHSMAMPAWQHPEILVQLERSIYAPGASEMLQQLYEQLSARRRACFGTDCRVVDAWDVVTDQDGDFRLKCDARMPV